MEIINLKQKRDVADYERSLRLRAASERFEEVRNLVRKSEGYDLIQMTAGCWGIKAGGKTIIQWWPSSEKWQDQTFSKTIHGGVDDFIRFWSDRQKFR